METKRTAPAVRKEWFIASASDTSQNHRQPISQTLGSSGRLMFARVCAFVRNAVSYWLDEPEPSLNEPSQTVAQRRRDIPGGLLAAP